MDARQLISDSRWAAYGHAAVDADYVYWEPKAEEMNARGVELGIADYFWRRLIGWQAGSADRALYGPYADPPSPLHAIPGAVVPNPDPPPAPTPTCPCQAQFDSIMSALSAQAAKVEAMQAENRAGFAAIAAWTKRAFPWVK